MVTGLWTVRVQPSWLGSRKSHGRGFKYAGVGSNLYLDGAPCYPPCVFACLVGHHGADSKEESPGIEELFELSKFEFSTFYQEGRVVRHFVYLSEA